jgi:methylated-DNA-[protein]-cysteine S-methyltransferase
MRAVGMANGRNPVAVVVPCHRVIEKNGQLGGYSSGLPRKRFLLQLEGVHVSGDDVRPGQLELL